MDNYSFLNVKPSIDQSQVSSVKDMIFKRAREKAASMTEEKNNDYTASVQNDVMQQARSSVQISNSKPQFGGLVTSSKVPDKVSTTNAKNTTADNTKAVKSADTTQLSQNQLKYNVQSADNSNYVKSMRDETMSAASSQYSGRRMNLQNTLSFLNTQAAIQAVGKTHSKIV